MMWHTHDKLRRGSAVRWGWCEVEVVEVVAQHARNLYKLFEREEENTLHLNRSSLREAAYVERG